MYKTFGGILVTETQMESLKSTGDIPQLCTRCVPSNGWITMRNGTLSHFNSDVAVEEGKLLCYLEDIP